MSAPRVADQTSTLPTQTIEAANDVADVLGDRVRPRIVRRRKTTLLVCRQLELLPELVGERAEILEAQARPSMKQEDLLGRNPVANPRAWASPRQQTPAPPHGDRLTHDIASRRTFGTPAGSYALSPMCSRPPLGDIEGVDSRLDAPSSVDDPREAVELLLRELRARPDGLSSREAERRLVAYGRNELVRRGGAAGRGSWRSSSRTRSRCCSGSRRRSPSSRARRCSAARSSP